MPDVRPMSGHSHRRVSWARPLLITAVLVLYPMLSGFDLAHHVVPPEQIRDGGPAKDAIPAVRDPQFVKASQATFLEANDKVIGVVVEGRARAYPIRILNWHEVVDDSIEGTPLAVTFCPLVQGAAVYKRTGGGGQTLVFGVSGKLYQSNLVLYDANTQSLWSQLDGRALAGPMAGQKLSAIPSTVTTWEAWRKKHPETDVLSLNTGYARDYGIDPYWGYEHGAELASPVTHLDERLDPHEIVLGISAGGQDEAFPLSKLAGAPMPLRIQLGGADLTINYDAGSGAASASVAGERIPAYDGYWFAWAAFHPATAIWSPAPRANKHPVAN
jgi:uncharacterized protein DUF3179